MRGGDSSGLRAYNERLIVDVILREGPQSKAALARKTGLSANAAMVIANRLIERGVLLKGDPVRGKIGQPSTPIGVNPEGAFALGVKIGRRNLQTVLVNLAGEVVELLEEHYPFPEPLATIDAAKGQCRRLLQGLSAEQRADVVGVGIAMPSELEAWAEELGLAPGALDAWRDADIASDLAHATDLEIALYNDGSAACAAEMIAGDGIVHRTALYLYVGTFIGGGVVLDGRLYRGERHNAGAIGSMPAPGAGATGEQLIHRASLLQLERLMEQTGLDLVTVTRDRPTPAAEAVFARWMETAVPALVRAILSAISVIDFEAVVIDGRLPPQWRRMLTAKVAKGFGEQNLSGLLPAQITTGSIGPMAPVLGAAMMPLRAEFAPDPDLVLRS